MIRSLTILLSIPLFFLLLSTYPAGIQHFKSVPDIQETTLPTHSRGTAFGEHLMQYRGYPVSYVLEQVSDWPVTYELDNDPRIDFYYQYPELSTEEAKKVAIQKLADFVGGRLEEIESPTTGYLLERTPTFGKVTAADLDLTGVAKSVENNTVAATQVSMSGLADLLNEHRPEPFFANDDACCVNVRFVSDDSVKKLRNQLLSTAGVRLQAVERSVSVIRVTK
ncbi:MAG: hypothetical protein WA952_01825 [Lewinella sp.]